MVLCGNCARLNHFTFLTGLHSKRIKVVDLGKPHRNFLPFPWLNYLNFLLPSFLWSFPFLHSLGAFCFMWLNTTLNYTNKTIFDISSLGYYSESTTVIADSFNDWCPILTDPLKKRKTIVMKYPALKSINFALLHLWYRMFQILCIIC